MENIQIENAKTRFFESKEHYLKFKQAWKDFHNSDKLVWREDVEVYSWALERKVVMHNVKRTSLSAEHYLLYNLLRGYESTRGFAPLTKKNRLEATATFGGKENPWAAHELAKTFLIRASRDVEDVNAASEHMRQYARKNIQRMLLPFGDTVTLQMLVDIAKELYDKFPEFEVEEMKDFTIKKSEKMIV